MKDSELVRLPYFSQTSNEGYIYMHPSLNVALNSDLENNKTKLDLALKVLDCMVSKKGQQLIANGSGVISFNQGVPSMMNDVKGLEESLKIIIFIFVIPLKNRLWLPKKLSMDY